MNKRISLIASLAVIASIFLGINSIGAMQYNGSASSTAGFGPSDSNCSDSNKYCTYNNMNHQTIKITVRYIDGDAKKNQQIGHALYYTSSESVADAWKGIAVTGKDGENVVKSTPNDTRNYLIRYFSKNNWKNATELFEEFDISSDNQTLLNETQEANQNNPARKGYRIIIEPVFSFKYQGKFHLLTAKEILDIWANQPGKFTYSNTSSKSAARTRLEMFAHAYYTDFNDVGISGKRDNGNRCYVTSGSVSPTLQNDADEWNGCGYQIIDISWAPTTCVTVTPYVKTSLSCKNTDENNIGEYKEKTDVVACTDEAKTEGLDKNHESYGKFIRKYGNCSLYCLEEADISFPGNVSGSRNTGIKNWQDAYFAWPSRYGFGLYQMFMTVKKTCHVVADGNGPDSTCKNHNFTKEELTNDINFGAHLTAGTSSAGNAKYAIKNSTLDIDKSDIYCTNCGTVENDKDRTIYVAKQVYFKINPTKNRYYNRLTDLVSDEKGSDDKDIVFDRGEGVVALSSNDSVKNTYNLIINNVTLGTGNKFGTLIKDDYTCKYKLSTSDCRCPNGTLHEGEIVGTCKQVSCSEAQEKYCDKIEPIEKNCDPIIPVCTNSDGSTMNFSACINNYKSVGKSEEEARNLCEEENCEYCQDSNGKVHPLKDCKSKGNSTKSCIYKYCSAGPTCTGECTWKNTDISNVGTISKQYCNGSSEPCDIKFYCPGGPSKDMDPTPCVESALGVQNVTEALNKGWISEKQMQDALNKCEEVVCPIGKKIIYRVIDLNDPFPGKTIAGKASGFSNNNKKGRYPGSNWKSTLLVKNQILNARGAKGYKLYSDKTPLYTITLTSQTIKQIRDYNKNHVYSDFTLNCTSKSKNSKCISQFLHTTYRSILQGNGKCNGISNAAGFDNCYNDN